MSETTLDADVIKRTQDKLGKYVKKPPLTEKLLKKPPFRFLFDVVGVVIRETGYFETLYTPDELNIENISDREKKIQFLQKLIDVIKIATNEPLTVKPSKIVAGHEPEKTNELLQQIAIIIEKKLDWKTAVATVNNGGVPIKAKSKQKEKEKEVKEKNSTDKPSPKNPDTKKTSKEKPKAEVKEKVKSNDAAGKKPSKTNDSEKKEKKTKTKPSSRDSKDASKKASPEKPSKPNSERSPEVRKSENKVRLKEVGQMPSEEKATPPPTVEPPQVEQVQETEVATPVESGSPSAEYKRDKRRASKRAEEILLSAINEDSSVSENRRTSASRKSSAHSRKSSAEKVRLSAVDENNVKSSQEPPESLKTVVEEPSPETTNMPVPKNKSHPDTDQSIEVKRETTFVRENSKDSTVNPPRPRTSLRPPSARPASARPGAPRRRDKNIEIILQPNDQIKMSGINIKLETFKSDLEDDGENLVIIENPNTADPLLESRLDSAKVEEDETLQQGHLVQQILETQKELVHGSSPDIEPKLEKEYDKLSTRQSSATQMNSLRDLIQNLTKSVNPLGKLMDFIPEDIDSMQLELTMWRDTYTQSSIELKKERSLTESVTEPMKNQLTTIESTIREYQEMIDACRVKILQNAEKIQRLLTTQ